MSLRDELRKEADKKKAEEALLLSSQEKLQQVYEEKLLPKMQHIYDYFKEIVEYLEFLKEPIRIGEYSPRYKNLGELVQQDYKLSTDKFGGVAKYDELKEIMFRFYCSGEGKFPLDVFSQSEVEQQIKFLTAKKVPFEWSRQHNEATQAIACFMIERKIPVLIRFSVDLEAQSINLTIHNHYNFDVIERSYSCDDINEKFLDKLGRFLLRKDNSFIEIDISEEEKAAIRAHLQKEREKSEQSITYVQPLPEKESAGFFSRLGALFKS